MGMIHNFHVHVWSQDTKRSQFSAETLRPAFVKCVQKGPLFCGTSKTDFANILDQALVGAQMPVEDPDVAVLQEDVVDGEEWEGLGY